MQLSCFFLCHLCNSASSRPISCLCGYINGRLKTKRSRPLVCGELLQRVSARKTSNETEGNIEVIFSPSPNRWAFDEVQLIIYIFTEQMVPLRPASLEPLRAKGVCFLLDFPVRKTISSSNGDSRQTSFLPLGRAPGRTLACAGRLRSVLPGREAGEQRAGGGQSGERSGGVR